MKLPCHPLIEAVFVLQLLTIHSAAAIASRPPMENSAAPTAGLDPIEQASSAANSDMANEATSVGPSQNADECASSCQWHEDFNQRSFEWHLLTTKIIFFLVIFIVLFGMFVSWRQFRHDTLHSKLTSNEPDYDVAVSLQNVRIKTKTIGVIVLLSSAGFFMMYLIYVYPMTPVVTSRPVEHHSS